jgi:hypothetical protein
MHAAAGFKHHIKHTATATHAPKQQCERGCIDGGTQAD